MYTIQDVARILRFNQNMIIGLIKQRKLKANKVGKFYRISKEEYEIILKAIKDADTEAEF